MTFSTGCRLQKDRFRQAAFPPRDSTLRKGPTVEKPEAGDLPQDFTALLFAWRRGDPNALDQLTAAVYDELRAVASRQMQHERRDHTLQATALVHETYLKLVQLDRINWQGRAHFFGACAQSMRRIPR